MVENNKIKKLINYLLACNRLSVSKFKRLKSGRLDDKIEQLIELREEVSKEDKEQLFNSLIEEGINYPPILYFYIVFFAITIIVLIFYGIFRTFKIIFVFRRGSIFYKRRSGTSHNND